MKISLGTEPQADYCGPHVKIEREDASDLAVALREGLEVLVHGADAPQDPETRLLAKRDGKRRRLRNHWYAYSSVMAGLAVLNLVTWLVFGLAVPWVLFPAAGWGIGMSIHALTHRAWVGDRAREIEAAEVALGRLPAGPAVAALPAGEAAPAGPFAGVLAECRAAVDRTAAVLENLGHPAQDLDATRADLEEGLERIERLADGALRIDAALAQIAPDGAEGLQRRIDTVDDDINRAKTDALRAAHLENRALLIARRAKVEALLADRERMLAKVRGFLLATENLQLDAARVGTGAEAQELSAPIKRLQEEVEVLRKVEAEIGKLSAG